MTRSFFRLLSLAAVLTTGALANPTVMGANPVSLLEVRDQASPAGAAINPLNIALRPVEMAMTNGQRLARGLPLNKPLLRRADRTIRARARPSAVPATANAVAPGQCGPRTGVVHVTSEDGPADGNGPRPRLDGYLSNTANQFGEYGYTTDRSSALTVTINDCNGTPFDLISTNGFSAYPYVGGIAGFANNNADLNIGSANYAYIGGVTETPPHATPQSVGNSFTAATGITEASESAIWSFQQRDNTVLQAQWMNADGSMPSITLAYVPSQNAFVLLGDVGDFERAFENISESIFTFES